MRQGLARAAGFEGKMPMALRKLEKSSPCQIIPKIKAEGGSRQHLGGNPYICHWIKQKCVVDDA